MQCDDEFSSKGAGVSIKGRAVDLDHGCLAIACTLGKLHCFSGTPSRMIEHSIQ
jgi:hypothetical protein